MAGMGIRGFQGRLMDVVGDVLLPAKAFDDRALERRFLWEFRASGFSAIILFGFVGAVWTAVMLAYEIFAVPRTLGPSFGEIFNRGLVFALLFGMSLALLLRPEYAVERHRWLVVIPIAVCLIVLSGATIFSDTDFKPRSFRIVSSMIMACIGAYTCTRARPWEIAPWAILSGCLTTLGLLVAGEPAIQAVLVYLAVGNVVGWSLCVYIEHRERRLFIQAVHLEKLSGELSAKAPEAARESRERERLFQVVAHELRQPITSLQMYLFRLNSLAQMGSVESDAVLRALECSSMLQDNVDKLLPKNIKEGKFIRTLSIMPAQIMGRIRSVYCANKPGVEDTVHIHLFRTLLPPVISHEASVWTIVNNLIENAIKFRALNSSKKPMVVIAFTVLKSSLRIDVMDNGRGIPREQMQLVFEPYWQGSSREVAGVGIEQKSGVGLGLSIVRDTIDRLVGSFNKAGLEVGCWDTGKSLFAACSKGLQIVVSARMNTDVIPLFTESNKIELTGEASKLD